MYYYYMADTLRALLRSSASAAALRSTKQAATGGALALDTSTGVGRRVASLPRRLISRKAYSVCSMRFSGAKVCRFMQVGK